MRPAARVQSSQHQSSPHAHHADAQGQPGSCRSAQRQAEPGHQEARQGQHVHTEENVFGQPRAATVMCGLSPIRPYHLITLVRLAIAIDVN